MGINSINQVRRSGDRFVKRITGGGSPHAEVAVSKGFDELGVPHIPVEHERKDGHDYVTAEWRPDLHTLASLGASYHNANHPNILPQLTHVFHDKRRIGQLALAEWLMAVDDRHSGNYALDRGHGLLSIDHGWAFHPATLDWPEISKQNPNDLGEDGYKFDANDRNNGARMSIDPLDSELFYQLTASGMPQSEQHVIPIHPDDIKQALHAEPRIVSLAHEATQGLLDHDRQNAADAVRARYHVLKRHLQESPTLNIRDLSALTEEANHGLRQ